MKRIFCLLTILFCTLFAFNASAQEERDSPRRGEGISVFLERNKRPGRAYYKEFLELNKKLLKGKEELRLGVKYVLPPLSKPVGNGKKTINEPLFGKALASVKVTSNRLQGACFYVVSGHGGPDPGAIGRIGKIELHEDEYAYDVALRLARNLMQEGAEVRIIIQDAKDGIRDDKYLSNSKRETCMGAPMHVSRLLLERYLSSRIPSLASWIMIRTSAPSCIKLRARRKATSYAYSSSCSSILPILPIAPGSGPPCPLTT